MIIKHYAKNTVEQVKCATRHVHCAHNILHAAYFGMVAWESAKWYGVISLGLLVLVLIDIANGEE